MVNAIIVTLEDKHSFTSLRFRIPIYNPDNEDYMEYENEYTIIPESDENISRPVSKTFQLQTPEILDRLLMFKGTVYLIFMDPQCNDVR